LARNPGNRLRRLLRAARERGKALQQGGPEETRCDMMKRSSTSESVLQKAGRGGSLSLKKDICPGGERSRFERLLQSNRGLQDPRPRTHLSTERSKKSSGNNSVSGKRFREQGLFKDTGELLQEERSPLTAVGRSDVNERGGRFLFEEKHPTPCAEKTLRRSVNEEII